MAVFHRKPDGKRKIYPISIFRFGSVFSSASADPVLRTTKAPEPVGSGAFLYIASVTFIKFLMFIVNLLLTSADLHAILSAEVNDKR